MPFSGLSGFVVEAGLGIIGEWKIDDDDRMGLFLGHVGMR
jgi:hypothetical protein